MKFEIFPTADILIGVFWLLHHAVWWVGVIVYNEHTTCIYGVKVSSSLVHITVTQHTICLLDSKLYPKFFPYM